MRSWTGRETRNPGGMAGYRTSAIASVMALALLVALPGATSAPDPQRGGGRASVIVLAAPGAVGSVEHAVEDLGGEVERRLSIIDAVVAELPESVLASLEGSPFVRAVTPNARIQLQGLMDGHDADQDPNSMRWVNEIVGATDYWSSNVTGYGVDVALIDSGVVPVNGLTYAGEVAGRETSVVSVDGLTPTEEVLVTGSDAEVVPIGTDAATASWKTYPGKVVNGPDLSFESQAANLRYLDTFGHGTHMAGIIAGFDDGSPKPKQVDPTTTFMGVAPGARIVSVKVADSSGAVDVSQVIAGIDWVVQHRNDPGMNIRVLNLSFGTDGVQDYVLDPLTYAVEVAWRKGIVVVVAAGNRGYGSAKLNNPAYDPLVIAVGGADGHGTYGTADDTLPSFSSCGDGTRNPDLVAPGQSVLSLRAPGSYADLTYPSARVGSTPRFFRGSGTSQAAAVVSGAAALVIEQRPGITPDQLKELLTTTAQPVPSATVACQGSGMLDLKVALHAATPSVEESAQPSALATGLGSLNAARGSAILVDGRSALDTERDIFGQKWDAVDWAAKSWSGTSWSGGTWNGKSWSGDSWSGSSWAAKSWSAISWSAKSWSAKSWSAVSWSSNTWSMSAKSWSGASWSDYGWSAKSWSSNVWSTGSWG